MEFDPSTAEPVTAVVEAGFDPESAKPVQTGEKVNEKYRNQFTIPEEEFKSASPIGRLKMLLSHPWDKYVASVDQGFKGIDIPRVEADQGTGFVNRAGQVGAALDNTATGVAGGIVSPGGAAAIVSPGTVLYAAPRFVAGGIEHIVDAVKGAVSGEDNLQTTAEKAAGGALMLAGGAHGIKSGLKSSLAPKTPEQAIDLVKQEAENTPDPTAKAALEAAAVKISDSAEKGVAFDPQSASPVAGPETTRLSSTPDGAKKLEEIQTALKSPGSVIQYNVWPKESLAPGVDRTAQIDVIDPQNPQPGGNGSGSRALFNELGIDAPPAPDSLAPGTYTLDQIKEAIAAESSPKPEVKTAKELISDILKKNPNADTTAPEMLLGDKNYQVAEVPISEIGPVFGESTVQKNVVAKYMTTPSTDPIVLARVDGVLRPVDGKHRLTAARNTGEETIRAYVPVDDPVVQKSVPQAQETPVVGLGAASPAEFQPVKEFTTSAKNAQMDAEAKAMGQEPAMAQARQSNPETWDRAMKMIDENQNLPDELISELKEKSRPISTEEQAVLLHRNIELQNAFNKAERNIKENIGTPDSLAADRATQERVLDELIDVRAVNKASGGSEVGRSLQFRRAQAAEDFSLATMLAERRVARGGAKLTPEEEAEVRKQNAAIEDAQRALDQHEAQLELDDAITTPAEAESQITKLESEIKAAKESPQSTKRLEDFKKRTEKRIEELRDKVRRGDFSKKSREAPHLDHEGNVLQAKLEEAKGDFNAALEKDKYDRLSGIQKLRVKAADVYDAARNLMTTGEFSFVLRQGKLAAASHPIMAARALPKAFQALFADETTAHAIDLQTFNHPDAADARAAGLHLVEEGARLSAREEALASTLADKLPLLRNFNQAGRVFLNKLRFDLYEAMNRSDFGPEQRKAIAQYANEATGRGSLGQLERAAVPLARVLFAPRYLASRLQYLAGHSLWGGDLSTRRVIATEYARTLVGLGAYYASLNAAFNALTDDKSKKPAIGFDPRSSDFGKIKIGNTRLDPLAGLSQVIVFAARTASGEKTNAKGAVVPLRGKVPYGGQKWSDVAATFARSKLHPIPGAIINLFDGTDLAGNKVTPLSQAENMVAPLTYVDVYQALEEQDLPEGVALSLLTLLGEGLQTYKNQKPKKQMGQPPPMLKK